MFMQMMQDAANFPSSNRSTHEFVRCKRRLHKSSHFIVASGLRFFFFLHFRTYCATALIINGTVEEAVKTVRLEIAIA